MSKVSKGNYNVQVATDEMIIEVSKTKESLHVTNFARFGLVLNDLNLTWTHGQAFQR